MSGLNNGGAEDELDYNSDEEEDSGDCHDDDGLYMDDRLREQEILEQLGTPALICFTGVLAVIDGVGAVLDGAKAVGRVINKAKDAFRDTFKEQDRMTDEERAFDNMYRDTSSDPIHPITAAVAMGIFGGVAVAKVAERLRDSVKKTMGGLSKK